MVLNVNRIKVLLAQQDKSQKDLAKYIGMNQASVSKLFKLGTTRESTVEKIAEFFKVPISEVTITHIPPSLVDYDSEMEKQIEHLTNRVKDLERIIELQHELIDTLKHKP